MHAHAHTRYRFTQTKPLLHVHVKTEFWTGVPTPCSTGAACWNANCPLVAAAPPAFTPPIGAAPPIMPPPPPPAAAGAPIAPFVFLRCCRTTSSKCCVTSLPDETGAYIVLLDRASVRECSRCRPTCKKSQSVLIVAGFALACSSNACVWACVWACVCARVCLRVPAFGARHHRTEGRVYARFRSHVLIGSGAFH